MNDRNANSSSYRMILRGLLLVGSASVVTLLCSAARSKLLAYVGGATAVGTVGLLASFISLAFTTGGLGLGVAGVREIAAAKDDGSRNAARLALRRYALVLALVTFTVIAVASAPINARVFEGALAPAFVCAAGLGAAAMIGSMALSTELRGVQMIRALAKGRSLAAVLAAFGAATALFLLRGNWALVAFAVSLPFASLLVFAWVLGRGAPLQGAGASWRESQSHFRGFASLGIPVAASGFAASGAALLLRMVVDQRAGTATLGLFVAAFAVSEQYLGIVLQSMATDYFPRLAAVIDTPEEANVLIRRQSRLLLTVGCPVLFGMLAVSPWLLPLLYAAEFDEATTVYCLLVASGLLKMLAWPLGYAILARGRSLMFTAKELSVHATYLAVAFFFFDNELWIIGLAYIVCRIVNLAWLVLYVRHALNHTMSAWCMQRAALVSLGLALVLGVREWNELAAAGVAAVFSAALGVDALKVLLSIFRGTFRPADDT
ncbi:MAG: oligosaccharide flippase family protein [Myxococcota bacterium]